MKISSIIFGATLIMAANASAITYPDADTEIQYPALTYEPALTDTQEVPDSQVDVGLKDGFGVWKCVKNCGKRLYQFLAGRPEAGPYSGPVAEGYIDETSADDYAATTDSQAEAEAETDLLSHATASALNAEAAVAAVTGKSDDQVQEQVDKLQTQVDAELEEITHEAMQDGDFGDFGGGNSGNAGNNGDVVEMTPSQKLKWHQYKFWNKTCRESQKLMNLKWKECKKTNSCPRIEHQVLNAHRQCEHAMSKAWRRFTGSMSHGFRKMFRIKPQY